MIKNALHYRTAHINRTLYSSNNPAQSHTELVSTLAKHYLAILGVQPHEDLIRQSWYTALAMDTNRRSPEYRAGMLETIPRVSVMLFPFYPFHPELVRIILFLCFYCDSISFNNN
jgi:hypothetical protein